MDHNKKAIAFTNAFILINRLKLDETLDEATIEALDQICGAVSQVADTHNDLAQVLESISHGRRMVN